MSRIEGQVLGTGPVYADDADTPGTVPYLPALAPQGREAHVMRWLAAPAYQGPVLVRGRRLDAPGEVLFGPTSGTAASELQLYQGATPAHPDWRVWRAETTVTGPGCYAYQVDGTNFSQVIVFRVVASAATPNP